MPELRRPIQQGDEHVAMFRMPRGSDGLCLAADLAAVASDAVRDPTAGIHSEYLGGCEFRVTIPARDIDEVYAVAFSRAGGVRFEHVGRWHPDEYPWACT